METKRSGSLTSYKQESEELRAQVQVMMGEKFSIITGDVERVRKLGIRDKALAVGEAAPDFTLPDAFGHHISLRTLLAQGPVVVSFYRGEWCPYCNIELRALQQALAAISELGASLVAISPEKPNQGTVVAEKNQLTFPVLSDFRNVVAHKFGIVFQFTDEVKQFAINEFNIDLALKNGEDSYELPVPATFVVDSTGIIRFAHVDVDYMTGRAEPEAVVAALRAIPHAVS